MNDEPSIGSILVIGEALVDVIIRPFRTHEVLAGGSPLNVAIGLQRLGVATVLHTSFGTDEYGELIAEHVAESGVRITATSRTSTPTSVAEARIQPDGSAAYNFTVEWQLQPAPLPSTDFAAVHIGSIGAVLEPGASVVEREVQSLCSRATVSYDPNIRPQLMGTPGATRRRVERIIAFSDVVKASDEDMAWLYPSMEVREIARSWLALGASLVVITKGADGAYAVMRAGTTGVAARAATTVDTVGAGDSFMSGLLAALADRGLLGRRNAGRLRSLDLDTAHDILDFAARCAAITVGRRGANPPTRVDLRATQAESFRVSSQPRTVGSA